MNICIYTEGARRDGIPETRRGSARGNMHFGFSSVGHVVVVAQSNVREQKSVGYGPLSLIYI